MERIRFRQPARLPLEWAADFQQDAVHAFRVLAKSPGFTLIGILSLAIGIGMCSVILSESNALLRSAPGIARPATLLTMRKAVSYPYFEAYRDRHDVIESAAALLTIVPFAVASAIENSVPAERIYGQIVSPEYFATLGVTPAAGRFFDPAMEKSGDPPVAVVTDRFWRTHLDSDPGAVGRRIRVNGRIATIIGIAPRDFSGLWPWNPSDLFLPATMDPATAPRTGERSAPSQ